MKKVLIKYEFENRQTSETRDGAPAIPSDNGAPFSGRRREDRRVTRKRVDNGAREDRAKQEEQEERKEASRRKGRAAKCEGRKTGRERKLEDKAETKIESREEPDEVDADDSDEEEWLRAVHSLGSGTESTGGIDSPVDCVDDCCIGLSSRGKEPQNVEKEVADRRKSRRRSPRRPVVYNGCSNDCGCDHPAADEARSSKNAPSELVT